MTYSQIDTDTDFDPDDTLKLVPFGSNAKYKDYVA